MESNRKLKNQKWAILTIINDWHLMLCYAAGTVLQTLHKTSSFILPTMMEYRPSYPFYRSKTGTQRS